MGYLYVWMPVIELCVDAVVAVCPESNTLPVSLNNQVPTILSCRVLITMGAHMKHWEDNVAVGGLLSIRHSFVPLKSDNSYTNQTDWNESKAITHPATGAFLAAKGVHVPSAEDLLPRSHCIVWVYATYTENNVAPGGKDKLFTESKQRDEPKRAFLIGSRVVDLGELFGALAKSGTHDVRCMHNFNDTQAIVTFKKAANRDYSNDLRNMTDMTHAGTVVASSLGQLEAILHLVKLQEGLVSTYCVDKVQEGILRFSDSMGGQFLKLSTFLQLFGAAVCFSDMTAIVRSRAVEFPMHLVMVFAYHAVQALVLDINALIESPNDTVLIRFFKVCEISELNS